MKRNSKVCLITAILLSLLALNSLAAVASEENTAVYCRHDMTVSGTSLIEGDAVVAGGTLTAVGNPEVIGTVYYAGGVNVDINKHIDTVTAAPYTGSTYRFDSYADVQMPAAETFSGCTYSDGTADIELAYYVNSPSKKDDGFVLTESAYLSKLKIPSGLTMYVDVPENTVRVIAVKNAEINGSLVIKGEGALYIYIENRYNLSNSSINAGGQPDKCVIYYKDDLRNCTNMDFCGSIITEGSADMSAIKSFVGNIYIGKEFKATGNSVINGLVYAPESDTKIAGSGRINGQIVTKTLKLNGNAVISYAKTYPVSESFANSIITGTFNAAADEKTEDTPVAKPDSKPEEDKKDEETKPDNDGDLQDENVLNVVEYDVAAETYTHGTMQLNKKYAIKENGSGKQVSYYVFDETTFTPDDSEVTEKLKDDITEIADKTNSVFESRKGKIVEQRFGRIDSRAYQFNLTVSPYVVPALKGANSHKIWLVMGNRQGEVENVWMSVK